MQTCCERMARLMVRHIFLLNLEIFNVLSLAFGLRHVGRLE